MTSNSLHTIYSGKKVFLTGHTGFKGTWLLMWLHHLGANIKGYSLDPLQKEDLYNQVNGGNICTSVIADIRDRERLKKEILEFNPDFIFHLAAQPLVRASYLNPLDTYEINTIGTANVLDSLRFMEQPCTTVIVTTDKVYENKEWQYPYREADVLGGFDPYSSSKAMAELCVSSYRNSFFHLSRLGTHQKSIATARAGNVIGGGDWAKDRIIPDIIRAIKNNEPVIIRNPNSVRPWQHVLESLHGYLTLGALLENDPFKFSDAWNFGPIEQKGISVSQLVKKAIYIWGSGNYIIEENLNAPHEAGILKLDISKTISLLGWTPQWDAALSIEKTIQWYKKNNSQNIKNLVLDDIKNYEQFINNEQQ